MHIVLVHGAWADGSSWAPVIEALTARGFDVTAAPLPLTSLADDVRALDRSLARIDGDVVLAGHAYGGAVMGSTTSPKVKALVYIAGIAPDEGEKIAEVTYRAPPHPSAPRLAPDENGLVWLPDTAFAAAFAQDAPAPIQARLRAVQRPIAVACIGVPVGPQRWHRLPSWYLLATADRMIPEVTQRFMAERMGAHLRVAAVDHAPAMTAPEHVVGVIVDAARAVS